MALPSHHRKFLRSRLNEVKIIDTIRTEISGRSKTSAGFATEVKKLPDILSEEPYFYGSRNFAHFHGPRRMDIRLSPEDQKQALVAGKALPHLYAPRKAWVSCTLDSEKTRQ